MALLVFAGVIAAAALLVVAIVFSMGRAVSDVFENVKPGGMLATVLPQSTPTMIVRPPAMLQVRAAADLVTAQTLMSTVVEAEKARVGSIVYERLVLIACGRVRAGIDLSNLRAEDVIVDGERVTVRLPRAEIQDVYLIDDETSRCTTRVFDRTNLVLLPQSKDLESQAREKAVQAIRATAVESGILEDADRNGRMIIEHMLLLAGYREVRFIGNE